MNKGWQQALGERARRADEDPPVLFAPHDVGREWVLVPRAHLRTIQSWAGEIDEATAILMCAEILADARFIGVAASPIDLCESENLGTDGPLSCFPVRSDHGDVHTINVARSNGDSVTVEEYQRVFRAVTGHDLTDGEVDMVRGWFAEEDR